jgi:hypothetical protein
VNAEDNMHITFVKKIKSDGQPCRKCAEVEQRLIESGMMARINETVIADERDDQSPGMLLAAKYQVTQAPFFIVRADGGAERVYTVYFKFVREILNSTVSEHDETKELLDQNPDLATYI